MSSVADDARARSVWNCETELGEGPVWVDGALWFVDIKKQKIHRFEAASGTRRSWDSPEQIGFLLPRRGGGFVAGLQSGLYRFDEQDGGFEPIAVVEPELPGNRLNDGAVDILGRLWFGSMDNGEKQSTGRFYRFAGGALDDAGLPPVAITNGPALSGDGRILYWVDTLGRTIHSCPVADDGTLGSSTLFATIAKGEGFPDGPTVDSDGCVWVGLYEGWEARRYSPGGELVGRVRFPVANITKVAFGGADLQTIYATTARQGLGPEELAAQPEAGALFAVGTDIAGLPCPEAEL